MKYRFFYGTKPNIRNLRPGDFSGKGYVCDLLLQTRWGTPVTVYEVPLEGCRKGGTS